MARFYRRRSYTRNYNHYYRPRASGTYKTIRYLRNKLYKTKRSSRNRAARARHIEEPDKYLLSVLTKAYRHLGAKENARVMAARTVGAIPVVQGNNAAAGNPHQNPIV